VRGREDDVPFVLPAGELPSVLPAEDELEVVAPPRRRGLAAFGQGLAAPGRGFVYVAERPGLWPYGILPVLLNLLITAGLVVGFYYGVKELALRLHEHFSGFFGRILEGLSVVGLVLAAIVAAVAAWYLLQGVLCDFFYRKLSRKVELQLGARREELHHVSFLADLADTLLAMGALLVFNLAFLFLHCVPVVGSLLFLVCSATFSSWVFGIDYLSFPLALRGLRRRQRLAFAREYRGQTLGLGAVVFLCNLLPVVNAVLLTSAVVGAVLLHREVRGAEDVLEVLPAARRRR
jgi:CysZ protein